MNVTVRQIEFKSTNGANTVFGWVYIPGEPARGMVQIIHGMAEHMGRFHDFMRFLAQNGFAACGIDQIGHGRSVINGQYGFFGETDGWKTLIDDQHRFHKIIRSESPDIRRTIVLGHSMGSAVARLYAVKFPQALDALILSGTMRGGVRVDLAHQLAVHAIRKNGPLYLDRSLNRTVFGGYNDRFKPLNSGFDWLSRDTELVRLYVEDPQCGNVFTTSAFRDLFTLIGRANDSKCFSAINPALPMLLISGSMDPAGEYGKGPTQVYNRYLKAGVQDIGLSLYEGGRHEMLNETNRAQVYDDLVAWMAARFPAVRGE